MRIPYFELAMVQQFAQDFHRRFCDRVGKQWGWGIDPSSQIGLKSCRAAAPIPELPLVMITMGFSHISSGKY